MMMTGKCHSDCETRNIFLFSFSEVDYIVVCTLQLMSLGDILERQFIYPLYPVLDVCNCLSKSNLDIHHDLHHPIFLTVWTSYITISIIVWWTVMCPETWYGRDESLQWCPWCFRWCSGGGVQVELSRGSGTWPLFSVWPINLTDSHVFRIQRECLPVTSKTRTWWPTQTWKTVMTEVPVNYRYLVCQF